VLEAVGSLAHGGGLHSPARCVRLAPRVAACNIRPCRFMVTAPLQPASKPITGRTELEGVATETVPITEYTTDGTCYGSGGTGRSGCPPTRCEMLSLLPN